MHSRLMDLKEGLFQIGECQTDSMQLPPLTSKMTGKAITLSEIQLGSFVASGTDYAFTH